MPKHTLEARTSTISVRVSYKTYREIRRKASQSNETVSSWVNQIIVHHLNESFRLPRLESLKVPPDTRLTTRKRSFGTNTPLLYKNLPLTLRELASHLNVSFIYMHKRLKKGDKLHKIVEQLER